jgi:putative flippase GtrA
MNAILARLSQISILRFAVIGALGMPVDWCVLQLCVHFGTGPYVGRVIAWLCAATFTWLGNRYFTFADSRAHSFTGTAAEWGRFLAANAVGGLVNVGLYSVMLRYAPPPFNDINIAFVSGVLLGLVFNFVLSKKMVFRRDVAAEPFKGPL